MRRLAFIISLLGFVLTTVAQNWTACDPYAYNDETVVYATLQSNVPEDPMSDFVVAAFIDGECRAEAAEAATGVDGSQFFILRVHGDQTADQGKTITFWAYHKPMQMTYLLQPSRTILYSGESEGTPSRRITLTLERQTGGPVALESFFLQGGQLVAGQTTRVELQPVPENALFDVMDVHLNFTGTINGWEVMQQRVGEVPLAFDLTPRYPGMTTLQVTVGGRPVPLLDVTGGPLTQVEVGASMPLQRGWQWRSNAYGDITPNNIYNILPGEQLVEARTQQTLLYNDPTWGFFGTLMEEGIGQNTCYKLKMSDNAEPAVLQQGRYENGHRVVLDGEWTWVGCPYYYDHPLGEALTAELTTLPEGMVIVTKEHGSAEYDGTGWHGDLTVLGSGEGLMVYNPQDEPLTLTFTPEARLPQGGLEAGARAATATSPWHYDASRFMNNTTIVATVADVELSDDWSVGVFVGNECRGEGRYVDGRFFITAHTDRGEQVTLRLCHQPSGRQTAVDGTIQTGQMRIGSLHQPLVLHSAAIVLGIGEATVPETAAGAAVYDLLGRKTTSGRLLIRHMADGTVRKVLNTTLHHVR